MMHLHVSLRVPPARVEELLDRIHALATECGTLSIISLIDEYREDIHVEFHPKEKPHGRSHHQAEDHRPRWD